MVLVVSMTPVMYSDISGEFPFLIVGALVGGVVGGVISYCKTGEINWRYVVGGALIGAGVGLLTEATIAYYSATTAFTVAGELGVSGITAGSSGYDLISNSEEISRSITDINSSYGGFEFNGSVDSVVNTASYYNDPYDQIGSILNGIAGNHLFFDGNKRTAFSTYYMLTERMGVAPKSATEIWGIINDIALGDYDYATDIANSIR